LIARQNLSFFLSGGRNHASMASTNCAYPRRDGQAELARITLAYGNSGLESASQAQRKRARSLANVRWDICWTAA